MFVFILPVAGPHTWAVHFPLASGKRQSPIDIQSGRGEAANFQSSLTWTYDSEACDRITNTGTGWKLLVNGNGASSTFNSFEHFGLSS